MQNSLESYQKNKKYLICVDSDGCAMDTMDVKHLRCFGPCMVREWNLQQWEAPILARWNEINLYTMTRGVNRFKGLAMQLGEINEQTTPIEGVAEFVDWVASTNELSNDGITRFIAAAQTPCPCFEKALAWSKAVNLSIQNLPEEEIKPFDGAKAGLAAAQKAADVAIVSSANKNAVLEEWQRFGLLEHVDILLAQDAGSKAHCIAELLLKGYAHTCVLMVGDAPGDYDAAAQNGVWYYPILTRHEAQSWAGLQEAIDHLIDGSYMEFGIKKLAEFKQNLGEA